MARNEEKQLARLNRFYLQKDKEAQRKKNPPRPRLETLNTTAEIQKWLPSIKRDLDFCIKQSEVTCYPQSKIDQFSRKINGLKWEYRSFVQKLRELNPGLEVTPWTDRPYSAHKRKAETSVCEDLDFTKHDDKTICLDSSSCVSLETPSSKCDRSTFDDKAAKLQESITPITTVDNRLSKDHVCSETNTDIIQIIQFTPISTPVLDKDSSYSSIYGYEKPPPVILNTNKQLEDAVLEFSTNQNCVTEGSSHTGRPSQTSADTHFSNTEQQNVHNVVGKRVEASLEVERRDKPLCFNSAELTAGQTSGHCVVFHRVSLQCSDILDPSATDKPSSNNTDLFTNISSMDSMEREFRGPLRSSLPVVPYSDTESDTEM